MKKLLSGLLSVLPGLSFGFTYFDGEFTDGTWTGSGLTHQSSGGSSGAYASYDYAAPGGGFQQFKYVWRDDFVYDPAVSGALENLEFSVDHAYLGGFQHNPSFLVLQDGQPYRCSVAPTSLTDPWKRYHAASLSAGDFWDYWHVQHPNFAANGTQMKFGVLVAYLTEDPGRVIGGIDNFMATNQPVPEPTSAMALGGLFLSFRRWSRQRGR